MPEPVSKQSNDLFDAVGYLSSLQYTPSVCNVYFFLALMCGTAPNALYTPGTVLGVMYGIAVHLICINYATLHT